MNLDSTKRVVNAFRLKVGLMREFWRAKAANVFANPVQNNMSKPFIASFLIVSAEKVACISGLCMSLILHISRMRNISKIFKPIIFSDTVDMVDIKNRPDAVHIKPNEFVSKIAQTLDANLNVTVGVFVAKSTTNRPSTVDAHIPCEHPSLRIVVKQFFQAFWGKIQFSHDTVPSLIGQKPARVFRTGGLRYFSPFQL